MSLQKLVRYLEELEDVTLCHWEVSVVNKKKDLKKKMYLGTLLVSHYSIGQINDNGWLMPPFYSTIIYIILDHKTIIKHYIIYVWICDNFGYL